MKKLVLSVITMLAIVATSFAQVHREVKHEVKVKKTATFGQHVHNTFHKHKHYNGYKVKTVKRVEKVHH